MKVCPKCMQQNADQARFCQVCQSPFDAAGALVCARGHNLDPSWTDCPYCRAENTSSAPAAAFAAAPGRPKTMIEDASAVPYGDPRRPVPPPPPSMPQPAPPPPAGGGGRRGKTVFIAPPQATTEEQQAPRPAERKIIGVLVTYSWRPEGQLFAVREGRNLIGRGAECEIQVPEDNTLSNVSSHITYRKSFTVGDMVSMSGTDLNGAPIEEQFVPLPSGAKLRTGSTYWTFLSLIPDTLPAEI